MPLCARIDQGSIGELRGYFCSGDEKFGSDATGHYGCCCIGTDWLLGLFWHQVINAEYDDTLQRTCSK